MKFHFPSRIKWHSFLLSMPVIAFVLNSILYDDRIFKDWKIWIISFPIIWVIGLGSWYMHEQYDHFIRVRLPELSQTFKRNLFKVLIYLLVMTPSVLLIFFVYDYFHILGYKIQIGDLRQGLLVGLCVNIIFETLWEVLYIIDKYKESLAERELLEQMSIEQEFENLKNQVNPHFLFNCFNTLSSLISEDKEKAEVFLDELSKVYRYLLRSNEDGFATLENEIKFIDSYCKLLKTRHGDGLQISIEIDKKYNPYLVPSLSLQLLVENAVKHNVVSKQDPLNIEIFTTSGKQLVVNNNLQRKQKKETSTKIGLNNIRAKYKLLQQDGFQIVEGEKNFMAVLPLVWNQQPVGDPKKLAGKN
jgi:two-component system LytT family sensor kinase